ncbi:MAG: hypothetical protein K2K10_02910 [Acetatifactor sp.]|nr:hypothetical protein [Acetatifactor sp.]
MREKMGMGKGRVILKSLLFLLAATLLSGCGTDTGIDAGIDAEMKESEISVEVLPEQAGQKTGAEQEMGAELAGTEQNAALYDRSPVSYDLSALPAMESRMYALWDGKVYFRQYTDESFEKGGLWADFKPIAGAEKALMCMEPDGGIVQTGADYGDGSMFIANGRLYSQRCQGETYKVYSCGLDGKDVEEYNSSYVLAAREGRIICQTTEGGLSYIDTNIDEKTGREHVLVEESAYYLDATEEEVFFYGYQKNKETESQELVLCAVDYEGTVSVLKMFTRQEYLDCMGQDELYEYPMDIPYFKCLGDTIYFSAGSYNGNAHMYSGGPIYSMEKDGSNCRVEAVSYGQFFYLYDDGENRILYYKDPDIRTTSEDTGIRPVNLRGTAQPGIVLPQPYSAYDEPYVHGESNSVLWYPDTSGVCYVLLTEEESAALAIDAYVDGSWMQAIEDIEYVDGRIFFTVTDLTYNRDSSIGWRDYYDRGRSACYCKDTESGEIRLLYEY